MYSLVRGRRTDGLAAEGCEGQGAAGASERGRAGGDEASRRRGRLEGRGGGEGVEEERKEIASAAAVEDQVKCLLGGQATTEDCEGDPGRLGGRTETRSCLMGEGGREGAIDNCEKAASIAAASRGS